MQSIRGHLGLALVVSGPSGVGKSTLCKQLVAGDDNLDFSISCTTRQARPGEVDGEDYFFMEEAEFQKSIRDGRYIEHAKVHDNYYGTPASEFKRHLPNGRDLLLDIDVQGVEQVQSNDASRPWRPFTSFVFIAPPSLDELERRLRGRATEDDDVIQRRLDVAVAELARWQRYDYLVINDHIEGALEGIRQILAAARQRAVLHGDAPPWV